MQGILYKTTVGMGPGSRVRSLERYYGGQASPGRQRKVIFFFVVGSCARGVCAGGGGHD